MRIDDPGFWAPQRRGNGRREAGLHPSSLFPIDQPGRDGDSKLLNFRVESVDVVALVLVSDHELSDFLEGDVMRPAPLIEESSSADT